MKALHGSNTDGSWMREVLERWRALEAPLRAALAASGRRRRRSRCGAGWRSPAGCASGSVMRLAAARFAAERAAGRAGAGGEGGGGPLPPDVARRLPRSGRGRRSRGGWRRPARGSGIPAGPEMGKILQRLLEWVLEDPARNTRDALLARATQGG